MAYHTYMTEVSILLGANETIAKEELWNIIEFERRLAEISVPEVERIDTSAIYHKLTIADLQDQVPQIDWMDYFKTLVAPMAIDESEEIVSYSTPFFVELGKLLEVTDKRVLHNYIIWRLVMDMMPHMPPQYEKTRAEFRRVLLGVLTDRLANAFFNFRFRLFIARPQRFRFHEFFSLFLKEIAGIDA